MNGDTPKILSIIPYQVYPARLGGEKGIAVFNEYLAKETELTGLTTKNNDPIFAKGYTLLNTLSNNKSRYANIFLFFKVKKLIRERGITHLLVEHPYFGWLAWLIKKTTAVQWIVHSHNIEYMRSRSIGRWWWKWLKMYEGWVYKNADKTFFISEDDLAFAVKELGVEQKKSLAVTYGIEQSGLPEDTQSSREKIRSLHNISSGEKILLFNGALYHSTNYEALQVILDEINPNLLAQTSFKYKIIVCGKGLPDWFNNLEEYTSKNVIHAGFVEDISIYFKAADIFLNPILSGGGVKTKAIEALAMDCTVISTPLGAMGINKDVCGNKMKIVPEGDWKDFANQVILSATEIDHTPVEFFEYYYWGNIIRRTVKWIS